MCIWWNFLFKELEKMKAEVEEEKGRMEGLVNEMKAEYERLKVLVFLILLFAPFGEIKLESIPMKRRAPILLLWCYHKTVVKDQKVENN